MSSNSIILEKFEKFKKYGEINEEIKRNIKHFHVFRDFSNEINLILVTYEDKVYCCGHNPYGVLGFGHENIIEFTINEELSNKSIVDFKTGYYHTIARNSDGKLYCWGDCEYLGNGGKDDEISKPELNKYLMNENIIGICCGQKHTLVLTSNNEVYGWGGNSIPLKLNGFNGEKVKEIACGFRHSMALTESECAYSWGDNRWGQLGLNSENENENKPKRIQVEAKIKKISCGQHHSLLLSLEGDIYVFGSNKYKQLGLKTNEEKQLTPIKLNHSEKFAEISSRYEYHFSAALSENDLYYVWGDCGTSLIISEPKEIQLKSFSEILIILTEFENGRYMNWKEMLELGEGQYGKVFRVEHKFLTNTIFAMKKIPAGRNPWDDDSFNEFSFSYLLQDKNEFVVKYYEGWFERDFQIINGIYNNYTWYIRMDLCDKTLSEVHEEIQNNSKLFINNSLTHLGYYLMSELFIEILKGVMYLHNNNIIHRDLHLKNILVKMRTNGNCIKIADFGLSKVHDKNKLNTGNIGTITYSAPEVLDSQYYNTKADIYSLGVILKELFGIDFNNKSTSDDSSDITSSECLKELYVNMTIEDNPHKRPDCQQILDRIEK